MLDRTYTILMRTTARIFDLYESKRLRRSIVTVENLEKAEQYLLKESMQQTQIEMDKGNLNTLRSKLVEDDDICLSSRALEGFKLNYDTDRYPILTTKDPLAYLWMKDVHEEDHTGATKTLSKRRRKYWIIRRNRLAHKTRSLCYQCRLLDKEIAGQLMAPLH